jgi:8-oxo-dGTP pyrophosphatase MutT (NUDIX family)
MKAAPARVLVRADDFKVRLTGDLELDAETVAAADRAWSAPDRPPGLTDGRLLVYQGHDAAGPIPVVRAARTRYRFFWADWHRPERTILPLAVSGAVSVADARGEVFLIGRRAPGVTQYPGWWELLPSGGLDAEAAADGSVDYQAQLQRELTEETGLTEDLVTSSCPLALIFDPGEKVVDLGVRMTLALDRESVMGRLAPGTEYDAFQLLSETELSSLAGTEPGLVPTSLTLLDLIAGRA